MYRFVTPRDLHISKLPAKEILSPPADGAPDSIQVRRVRLQLRRGIDIPLRDSHGRHGIRVDGRGQISALDIGRRVVRLIMRGRHGAMLR